MVQHDYILQKIFVGNLIIKKTLKIAICCRCVHSLHISIKHICLKMCLKCIFIEVYLWSISKKEKYHVTIFFDVVIFASTYIFNCWKHAIEIFAIWRKNYQTINFHQSKSNYFAQWQWFWYVFQIKCSFMPILIIPYFGCSKCSSVRK